MKSAIRYTLSLLLLTLFLGHLHAQNPAMLRGLSNRMSGMGRGGNNKDSLRHRNMNEDSITIRYYYLDTTRGYKFDSSIINLTNRFPVSPYDVYLGNLGYAARTLLFSPKLNDGWDYGLHAFDTYHFSLDKARFFNTSRPYTELGYVLGSQTQQIIDLLHTQNIKPNWNAAFQYRLISGPGFLKNQQTAHSNISLSSWYQSRSKRYNNYFVYLYNKSLVNENGGIVGDTALQNPLYSTRQFAIPVNLGNDVIYSPNVFSATLMVGNRYTQSQFMMRQQYDFGRKDSLVTDSTVIPLFYPRLRFENTTSISKFQYLFQDMPTASNTSSHDPLIANDSIFFRNAYNLSTKDTFSLRDSWNEINTDFSAYVFPEAKNLQQFLKVGAAFQVLHGTHAVYNETQFQWATSYYNLFLHGEYRNRTRNQKWDILANGNLYLTGYNSGDYHAYISMQRVLGSKLGSLQLGFENANSSPPYIFNTKSSFYLDSAKTFLKQNVTHLFGSFLEPRLKLQLTGDYYLMSNYFYLTNFYRLKQEPTLFNVLRLGALKAIRLNRHLNLYSELYVEQKTGSVQVNFPALYTRDRLAFEGVFYRNLNLSTGLEFRYHTPYAADGYSPVLGQFYYQDSVTITNRPEIDAFLNFRIRSFKAYVRAENLNSLGLSQGFGFYRNNLAAPTYPYPGLVFRLGIYWSFVN